MQLNVLAEEFKSNVHALLAASRECNELDLASVLLEVRLYNCVCIDMLTTCAAGLRQSVRDRGQAARHVDPSQCPAHGVAA